MRAASRMESAHDGERRPRNAISLKVRFRETRLSLLEDIMPSPKKNPPAFNRRVYVQKQNKLTDESVTDR